MNWSTAHEFAQRYREHMAKLEREVRPALLQIATDAYFEPRCLIRWEIQMAATDEMAGLSPEKGTPCPSPT